MPATVIPKQGQSMMYFHSNDVPKHKLLPLIGEEVRGGITGSTTYFIKSFHSIETIELMEDSKGIFQAFTKGLLLRVFKNNRSISLPIPFKEIDMLELIKGTEVCAPYYFSPMWILLKLGIRLEIARYFANGSEYSIEPTTLIIQTQAFKLKLESNGFAYNSQADYFSKFGEIKALEIK